jgi:hypothetical protein
VSKKTSRNSTAVFALLAAAIAIMLSFPSAVFASTDATPPRLSVSLSGDILTVTAEDDGSGVAAVYIDGHRVDELAGGTATANLKDYAGTAAKVAIYAVDGAGNRSETVEIDNPYSGAPAQQGGTQAAPSSGGANGADAASGGAVQEAVTGTPAAFTPEGTGSVLDTATDRDGKEFYTITTEAGNIFYLIIDRQRADSGVYFLNAVTEGDLAALAEGADEGEGIFGGSGTAPEPQEPATEPEPAPEPENGPEPEKSGGASAGTVAFVLIAAAIFGATAYYVKIVRPKRQAADSDADDEEWDGLFGEGEDAGIYPAEQEETGYLPDDDDIFPETPYEVSDGTAEYEGEGESEGEQPPQERDEAQRDRET